MQQYLPFIKGDSFDNKLIFKLDKQQKKATSRELFLTGAVKDKTVIHVGCVDHLEILEQKIKDNTWVHGLLIKAAKHCIGIDINHKGIEILRAKGISDVYCYNIISPVILEIIKNNTWDYILLGEILEHINEPFNFLECIHKNYTGIVKKIIITIPNAFRLKNFKNNLKNKEEINSDHYFQFSPYTITKLLVNTGFNVTRINFEMNGNINNSGPLNKILLKKFPLLRDTIIISADF